MNKVDIKNGMILLQRNGKNVMLLKIKRLSK